MESKIDKDEKSSYKGFKDSCIEDDLKKIKITDSDYKQDKNKFSNIENDSKNFYNDEKNSVTEQNDHKEADAEFEALLRKPNCGSSEVSSHPKAQILSAGIKMY
jgi:hypothetical protein